MQQLVTTTSKPGGDKHLDILKMGQRLRSTRAGNWNLLWEELSELFYPTRQGFLGDETEGDTRRDCLYTSGPELARRALATTLSTMLRPPGQYWFKAKAKRHELNQDPEVAGWLDAVTKITFEHLYDPRSKAEQNLAQLDSDLVTFGTGCCRIGWNDKDGHFTFKTKHMRNVVYAVNHQGTIDMAWDFSKMTLRQLIQMFGEEKLSDSMKDELGQSSPNLDKEYEICHACVPNADYKRIEGKKGIHEFMSLWFDCKERELLDRGGYHDFTYLSPRWDTSTGEIYGRSPAMVALNDARVLNEINKTLLEGGQSAVRPPLGAWSDMIAGDVELYPGGLTLFDMTGKMDRSGAPIWPIQTGTLPREILEFASLIEERIHAAFYRDVLELPSARDADITATEVNARMDQYQRQAAPVFSRLNDDYNAQMVNRLFTIGLNQGIYPPVPEQLAGQDIEFEYESPLTQMRKKADAAKVLEGLNSIGMVAEMVGPEGAMQMLGNYDLDELTRYLSLGYDLPEVIMKPVKALVAERDAIAKKAEMAEMAQLANTAAPAISAVGGLGGVAAKMNDSGMVPEQGGEGIPPEMIEGAGQAIDAEENPDELRNGGVEFDIDELIAQDEAA